MAECSTKKLDELIENVIEQLEKQHYMESTLIIYKRTYRRIKSFMKQQGVKEYKPQIGQAFISFQNVQSSTISAYSCAVRRLNDCYFGKQYRYHHDNPSDDICSEYRNLLNDYINSCLENGNKERTIVNRQAACVRFFNFLSKSGYKDITLIDVDIIIKSLLIFANKDRYADIRLLFKYLFENKYIERDYSKIIPRYKRRIPIPTVYSIDEIKKIENSIDTSTDAGIRNICLIRLATRMGLRSGDIVKLKISEINFYTKYIKIIQEKTGLPLELEIPQEVYESIKLHLENLQKKHNRSSDDYVFHSMLAPYGQVTTSVVRHILNECMTVTDIDTTGRKHGPHALRSTLASLMINDGASYETVRKILGHSDPNVIKHYAKTDIEKLRLCSIDPPKPQNLFSDYLSGKKVFNRV